jgi:hypothetical protein
MSKRPLITNHEILITKSDSRKVSPAAKLLCSNLNVSLATGINILARLLPAPTDISPWTRPDQRIWPVYYDSSSQMLCQMVQTPQHETATPGTANTSWQYYPAGIATRRFIAVSKDAASFQDSRPPPDAVPVTVPLKHLPTPVFRHCRPRLGMTRYEIRKLQRSPTTWQLYRCRNRTSLLMQRRSNAPILPCTNYCNKGTLTYLLQAMAVKG